ncbi:MAG: hypothetical protein RR336_12300, partial [Oscillospiraceae bacterium]
MNKLTIYTLLIITFSLLVGCGNKDINKSLDETAFNSVMAKEDTIVEPDVITIDIQTKSKNNISTKSYSDSNKIEAICDYIRNLSWYDLQNGNPDDENGTKYVVTYTNEDSTTKTYYFKDSCYFKTNNF